MITQETAVPEECRPESHKLPAAPTIVPQVVWATLSPVQQHRLYQELVRVCRYLLSREVHDERAA